MARLAKEKFLVLSTEDTVDGRTLLRIASSKSERMHFIGTMSDGQELVGYMKGEGKYADREKYPLPDKMLLDLILPKKDAFEVSEWLRGQPFEDSIVVVFSGADRIQSVEKPGAIGSNSFLTETGKRFGPSELVRLLREYIDHK